MDSPLSMNVVAYVVAFFCIIIALFSAFIKKEKFSEIKNHTDFDEIARICLIIGFALSGMATAILFYTQQETNVCIVNSIKNLQTDCLKFSLLEDILIIINIIGFSAISISSSIALRKNSKKKQQNH